ncbi:MAG TPA: hypothetical protein VKR32_08445 [Puia sp.]|nr:hypothetical protein [Puia sp.]
MEQYQIFYTKFQGTNTILLTTDWEKSLLVDGPPDNIFCIQDKQTNVLNIACSNKASIPELKTFELVEYHFVGTWSISYLESTTRVKANGNKLTVELLPDTRYNIKGEIRRNGISRGLFHLA